MSAYRVITTPIQEEEVEFDILRTIINSVEVVWDKTLYDEEFNLAIKEYLNTKNNEDELRDELLEQYSTDMFESFRPD